jgi:hypothetical protein
VTAPESYLGIQPEHYIAYSPRGPGLQCATVYFVHGQDVYGWWIGFRDYQYPSAFFKLEKFFSTADTVFYATDGSDVYGGWRYNYASSKPKLDAPIPIDEEPCHQLERLQDAFAGEWLWIRGDPGTEQDAAAYASAELATERVNVRYRALGKFAKDSPVWIHQSHGVNLDVVAYLTARWPLDYGNEE